MPPFERWGVEHGLVLALTVVIPLVLAWWTRRSGGGVARRVCEVGFALLLAAVEPVRVAYLSHVGQLPPWYEMAPMHLCDWALWACVIACLGRSVLAFECAYFWGLAGTLQGLITPELHEAFPSMKFLLFFAGHSGIVGCVLYLAASGAFRPRWFSVLRAYLGLLIYACVAGAYDVVAATNFGYLRAKPGVSSLLDQLGPWPWYIGSLLVVAAVNFVVLYAPWFVADVYQDRRHADGVGGWEG